MHMHKKKQWLAAVIGVALAQGVSAQDADSRVSFSGFGTVGFAHSSEDLADVTPDSQTDHGVGASQSISARLDTRLGVQMNVNFTDRLSGVVQAVSEYAGNESYSPKITMAHLKYRVAPDFNVRLGRLNMPFYMLSEYQRVGYAMPWARPPSEVYNYFMPLDGIEGMYKINAGEAIIGIQGFYGKITTKKADVSALRGLALSVEHGSSSYRISHIRGDIHFSTSSIETLFNTYEGLPIPPLVDLAKKLDPRGVDGSFTGIGYSFDPGNWFLRTEVVQGDYTPSMFGRTTSGYASAGMRIGSFTPAFTVAHVDNDGQVLPGALDPIGVLNGAVLGQHTNRHSFTASLRWDVRPSVAIKFQAGHIQNHAGSFGSLGNRQPGFVPGRSYNLLSASVDFVF